MSKSFIVKPAILFYLINKINNLESAAGVCVYHPNNHHHLVLGKYKIK
jgi:hypothetical protein